MDKSQHSTKTIKEFEDKLNINPEFFGLFREELLNMNTENINLETSESLKETNVPLKETNVLLKKESTKTVEPTKNIDNTKKESNKTIHIINDATTCDDLNTKLEIQNKKTDNLQSSTVLSMDDLKNLKLNKYELYKLEEIIKYFHLFENKK
jgi:hypothetical protein